MVIAFSHGALADQCTYQTWDWDTIQKKAVHQRTISKLKSEITPEERGDTPDCSVCEEDQVEIRIDRIARFKICKAMSPQIVSAIKNAIAAGFPFSSIVGYRVGKSKGPLNSAGERTQFSNHSFGTAIDFNWEKNGLYDFCIRFSPDCKLLRGGRLHTRCSGLDHERFVDLQRNAESRIQVGWRNFRKTKRFYALFS